MTPMLPVDENTIQRIKKGEEKAFSLLYDTYYTYLHVIALYYVFNRNDANAIVNDVFINIWNKREHLTYPILPYLIRSVQNRCINHIRDLQNQERILNEHKKQFFDALEEPIYRNETPLDYVEMKEIQEKIHKHIKFLPEKCRIVFEQYYYKGNSPEVIAKNLHININTVRVQIKNALGKLKKALTHLSFF